MPNMLRSIPKVIHRETVPAISMNLNSQATVKWCNTSCFSRSQFWTGRLVGHLTCILLVDLLICFIHLLTYAEKMFFFLCHQHICFRLLSFVKLIESPLVRQKPLPQSCLRTCGRLQLKERGKQISSLPRTSKIA